LSAARARRHGPAHGATSSLSSPARRAIQYSAGEARWQDEAANSRDCWIARFPQGGDNREVLIL
jgi:hypothetical protein